MKNVLLIILVLINTSCNRKDKKNLDNNQNSLIIPLQWKVDNEFQFNEIRFTEFPVSTLKKAYPKINKDKLKKLKNIPKLDSFLLVSTPMQRMPSAYRKYKNGGNDDKIFFFRAYKDHLKDTLLFLTKNIKSEFNAISGFSKNKQIVIADGNNNGDFADDDKLIFPIEFSNLSRNKISQWDSIPVLDFSYQLVDKDGIYDINRKVQVYPRAIHRHVSLLKNDLNDLLNSYTLMMELKDYSKGKTIQNSISYTIAIQGKEPRKSDIVIKPDSVFYPSHNLTMQSFFSYKKGDTVSLGDKWFKIKGISPDFKNIEFIETISEPKLTKKGIQFGKKLNDHFVTGLDGKEKSLFSEMNRSKLMVIDFWGTWCTPCKKLTPKLIDMHKNYRDKVAFVSIAYDKNVNDVKSYVNKNNMLWFHGFVDRKNKKNSIIDTWNIKSYPTFILINSDKEILYMGSGELVLDEINQIIKNKA